MPGDILAKSVIALDFKLQDQNGETREKKDFGGKWWLLYFYPRDDTPGCTKEACSFRDQSGEFAKRGVTVVGVSKDSVASHKKFAEKYHLKFTLLSDPEHKVIEKYGSWAEKKFMGRTYMGTMRNSFLINPKGEIIKEYKGVNPLTHASKIIPDLDDRK